MDNLTALNFLPQEQLNLAHSHESNELNRYQWLALSFLPFDPSVSQLMSAMSMECVYRLSNLKEVAGRMELDACVKAPSPRETPSLSKNSPHFFVVHEVMGQQILMRAEEASEATCTFFSWLLETNATPELHQLLSTFVKQKNNEHRVLQECREQWRMKPTGQALYKTKQATHNRVH
ncbi:MAG: Uncharacterized protein XD36_1049 [Halomonas sp. 54_146]|nr:MULTISPECIES: hypothetical protein [unclassified Halomonas]KUJ88601.1 MAG: Uncharacterized protein XD36_1049 [Halomonas sp. 54_146]HAA45839.1 hypothetical protein [Halomonas sp.]